ncbi:hypothetical protein CBR_g32244 [Chara braunii]|uniref:Uncharacterized protein n=1 Tax=Chara braunii TaxID=69332 RepID=A0A388JN62_CHABU|nr:hypothetical protein CBR_g32244 [Chara braunii]|eukprot:GBG59227.1 hypothetical protein CBR_g32244 [Chara braunii]
MTCHVTHSAVGLESRSSGIVSCHVAEAPKAGPSACRTMPSFLSYPCHVAVRLAAQTNVRRMSSAVSASDVSRRTLGAQGKAVHSKTTMHEGLVRRGVWPNHPASRQSVLQCSKSEGPVITTSTTPETSTTQTVTPAVTIEYQRQKAKELVAYFEEKNYEEKVIEGRIFGWTRQNEINNGRWTMFGIAVGLLTEYATGVSLVDQIKIIISNLGIADI